MKKRDSQRETVYTWERAIERKIGVPGRFLSLDECKDLVDRVWADYGMRGAPPTIKDGRRCRTASANRFKMSLPRRYRTPFVVLHELGHSITHQWFMDKKIPDNGWHGREFATLILNLYHRYLGLPKDEMLKQADLARNGVKFAATGDLPKPVKRPRKLHKSWFDLTLDEKRKSNDYKLIQRVNIKFL